MGRATMLDLMSVTASAPSRRPGFSLCQLLIEIVLSRDQADDEWKTPRVQPESNKYFKLSDEIFLSFISL